MENYKKYLGNGAYVKFDGYHIVLTTSNGIQTTNTITLGPTVFKALIDYEKQLSEILKAEKKLIELKKIKAKKDAKTKQK